MNPDPEALLDAIAELALDIARLCPDCGDKPERLVALVGQLKGARLDRGAIRDAIESEVLDSDLSDGQVRNTTEAVIRAARDET